MGMNTVKISAVVSIAVAGIVVLVGCGKKPEGDAAKAPGVGERTGAALDRAAEKTAAEARDGANIAVEKTGEALEKAGEALEKTGENLQK